MLAPSLPLAIEAREEARLLVSSGLLRSPTVSFRSPPVCSHVARSPPMPPPTSLGPCRLLESPPAS
eukprot:14028067-Alexandrium_andersonii.AAC.1